MNNKAANERFIASSDFSTRRNIGELNNSIRTKKTPEVFPSASVAVALMNSSDAVYPGKVKSKRALPEPSVATLRVPKGLRQSN